jgi:hypothetical protein
MIRIQLDDPARDRIEIVVLSTPGGRRHGSPNTSATTPRPSAIGPRKVRRINEP